MKISLNNCDTFKSDFRRVETREDYPRREKWIGEFSLCMLKRLELKGPTLFDISTDSNVNRYGVGLKCASRVRLKCASVVKTLNSSIAIPSHSLAFFSRFNVSMDTSCGAYTHDFHRNIWIAIYPSYESQNRCMAIICKRHRKLSCDLYHRFHSIFKVLYI